MAPKNFCTDNAAMIGLVGQCKFKNKIKSDYFFKANPRLSVDINKKL